MQWQVNKWQVWAPDVTTTEVLAFVCKISKVLPVFWLFGFIRLEQIKLQCDTHVSYVIWRHSLSIVCLVILWACIGLLVDIVVWGFYAMTSLIEGYYRSHSQFSCNCWSGVTKLASDAIYLAVFFLFFLFQILLFFQWYNNLSAWQTLYYAL